MKTEKKPKPKQRRNKSAKPDFKHAKREKNFVKKSKILYKRKFNTPLTKRKKQKSIYNAEEETRLEKIVFGNTNDIIDNLPDDETVLSKVKDELADVDEKDVQNEERKAAWVDDDDLNYDVDTALNAQNRKLPCKRPENLYTTYLKNRYKLFVGDPKWAKLEKKEKNEEDDIDADVLKHSCHLEAPKIKNLPKNIIDLKVLNALNKSTHTEGFIISSVEFHPSSTVALVAGSSGILSLYQVDGHTNDKLHSMEFKKYPISKATFMKEGTEVLLGSQYYPYCYTYDLMNDKAYKLPLPHGITNMTRYEVSPDGKFIALRGKRREIHLLHSATKELIDTFNMNSKCRTLAFTPDSKSIITHGDTSEMFVWDLNTRKCMNRAIDDGCFSCTSLDVSPSGQFVATGSLHGIVNIYDAKTVLEQRSPAPLKTVTNLVTSVTSLKFNPTTEILSAASVEKHNAFRMVHIPSFTVFSNFPTFQTNIGMPQTIAYSPGSGYLSIANRTGSAFLCRLRHYGNY
ncbi:U3 small nucleolar RNA-associated protein 18 homolog [Pseudomyrmex gracilis]|uniref:U3 small nucleolar RNA-associated protein 18 homolog n=1 Tax=Pseudomyrmex gracilis TaxID=219809 RepID=UPI00099554B8|nr:U3 small nucleolar RNA-associated protein 18 homolog [Pseudomyrmex gracilis]XP_020295665.1 U3 small nucleolar RNA-associated protein 18 homolog [Pseudomyrmex gracilis]